MLDTPITPPTTTPVASPSTKQAEPVNYDKNELNAKLDAFIESREDLTESDKKIMKALILGEAIPGLGPQSSLLSAVLEFKAQYDSIEIFAKVASSEVGVSNTARNILSNAIGSGKETV